jgi:hypothetical protein
MNFKGTAHEMIPYLRAQNAQFANDIRNWVFRNPTESSFPLISHNYLRIIGMIRECIVLLSSLIFD